MKGGSSSQKIVKFLLTLLIYLPVCWWLVSVAMSGSEVVQVTGRSRGFGLLEIALTIAASVSIAYASLDEKLERPGLRNAKAHRTYQILRSQRRTKFFMVLSGCLVISLTLATIADLLFNADPVIAADLYLHLVVFSLVLLAFSFGLNALVKKRK